MTSKERLLYIFFIMMLSAWFVSLLAVYLPTSKFVTPIFPVVIDSHIFVVFSVATALSSLTSFLIGLDKLGKLSSIRNRIRNTP